MRQTVNPTYSGYEKYRYIALYSNETLFHQRLCIFVTSSFCSRMKVINPLIRNLIQFVISTMIRRCTRIFYSHRVSYYRRFHQPQQNQLKSLLYLSRFPCKILVITGCWKICKTERRTGKKHGSPACKRKSIGTRRHVGTKTNGVRLRGGRAGGHGCKKKNGGIAGSLAGSKVIHVLPFFASSTGYGTSLQNTPARHRGRTL